MRLNQSVSMYFGRFRDPRKGKYFIPHSDHVVVHLLELLLGHLQGVRRRVDLVSLEALIRETDSERLVLILLERASV